MLGLLMLSGQVDEVFDLALKHRLLSLLGVGQDLHNQILKLCWYWD
jgi:hypothetical protein